ncbi:hypothetical protein [Streptomyces sp. NPDC007206]|uniref:hypothetical protein n=1 Tax=Streptomyces sp. NPDC007206 TaxID=3154317 RepID=UPI0033EDD8BE
MPDKTGQPGRTEHAWDPLERSRYAARYGPTTGTGSGSPTPITSSRWRTTGAVGPGRSGDEMVFGGGKVVRGSMGQSHIPRDDPRMPVDTGRRRVRRISPR